MAELWYHVVRCRDLGLREANPVIAYFGVTDSQDYAENLADSQETVGGTYLDVWEDDSPNFDMAWLAEG